MNKKGLLTIIFGKSNPLNDKHKERRIKRQDLFQIIFENSNPSDEELWNAGFGDVGVSIEVDKKNITSFDEFRYEYLRKNILCKLDFKCETNNGYIPEDQTNQINAIMKLIAYKAISSESSVNVCNLSRTSEIFLAKLGYTVYNFYSGYNISFDNPKETTLVETKYLTATTANEISEIIRKNITLSFLSKMRKEGRNYVIISADSRTHRILDELCLDYDIETFRSTSHQYYTFIDLRNFSFC